MKIILIGAGNLATRLGIALKGAGEEVMQVYSRTEESASRLGHLLGVPWTISLEQLYDGADLYIASVKDAALPHLIPQIVRKREEALFVHTAGSLPLSVWAGSATRYGVLYPMQTFSKEREVDFSSIPIFLEASSTKDLNLLHSLADKLSRSVYEANSSQRQALHLAAVFACNFTNYMYTVSEQLLTEAGLPFEVMLPLIDETAAKVHILKPEKAQTGPAMRYDENVIGKHLTALATHPAWQQLYEQISKNIHHDQLRLKEDKGNSL